MNDRADEIQAFANQFVGVLSSEALHDVRDWCENREWLLAIEVLAEKLYEAGITLDSEQRTTLAALVEVCGGDESRFVFLLS